MENLLQRNSKARFNWNQMGDIAKGRPHLGTSLPVEVYRSFEYAMYDTLYEELGEERAQELFQKAGYRVGMALASHALDLSVDMNRFLSDPTETMLTLQMGILRVERIEESTGEFVVTVAEDLDCSGLPATGEEICHYDEGLLAGIFEAYTQRKYAVKEVDCWASGDTVCRFTGRPEKE